MPAAIIISHDIGSACDVGEGTVVELAVVALVEGLQSEEEGGLEIGGNGTPLGPVVCRVCIMYKIEECRIPDTTSIHQSISRNGILV